MKAVPIYLVFGFLGSGKTTFLKIILNRLGYKKRVGIIQNEFSLSRIDSEFLDQSDIKFSLMEVNRGSAACLSLSGNFVPNLADFIKRENPQMIFVEASGLSDAVKIIKLLESPLLEGYLYISKSYAIVDASRFYHEVTFLRSVRNQIKHADTVILNKYDKLNRLEAPEEIIESYNYKKIESWISDINPFANIIPATYSNIPQEELDFISSESLGFYDNKNSPHSRVFCSEKKFSQEEIIEISQILEGCFKARGYLVSKKSGNFALRAQSGVVEVIPYNNPVERSEIIVSGESNKHSFLIDLFGQ